LKRATLIDIGRTDYAYAWDLQKLLLKERIEGRIPDTILFTEHNNTYTIGKSGGDDHLLASDSELHEKEIALFKIDRGGDITYHGPGQIVCYPIIDLSEHYKDIHRYLRDLEEVIIRTLKRYSIEAYREPDYTGVWVSGEKICAIGVKVSHWVTMHGFAFNVNTDLSYFGRIIPCGIFHKGVTSLSQVLERPVDMTEVKGVIAGELADVFQTEIENASYEQFIERYHIEPPDAASPLRVGKGRMENEHAST
jgi:lipoyl(octanoyl) transferase